MATLLAVETSTNLCSLAIHVAGRWFEHTQNVERLHNQVVLSQLDALVERSGVRRRELDVIAFGAGPGSFTGVRIAAAVAQAVAYAAGARVVPVSSSMALAHAYFAAPAAASEHGVLTVTRSRRDAFYVAGYRRPLAGLPEPWLDDRLCQGDIAPEGLPEAAGAGDRPPWWPNHLTFTATVAATARTVGEIALARFAAGDSVAPAQALPIYVSGDSPWRPAGR